MKAGLTISLASNFRTLFVSSAVLCKSASNRDVMDADENMFVSSRKCTVPAGDVIWAQISPASTMLKMCPSASSGCASPTLSEISVHANRRNGEKEVLPAQQNVQICEKVTNKLRAPLQQHPAYHSKGA